MRKMILFVVVLLSPAVAVAETLTLDQAVAIAIDGGVIPGMTGLAS